jgi:hypothetical protein
MSVQYLPYTIVDAGNGDYGWRIGLPDDWADRACVEVTYSDDATQQIAFPKTITALDFMETVNSMIRSLARKVCVKSFERV